MRSVLVALLVALVLAPAASAHTSVFSSDAKYRVVIGLLEEPVVTYQKTGLDLCFQANTTARAPVTVNPGGLTATLVSPDGKRLTQELRAQFGRTGCYQFQDPFVLTVPGQYNVELSGDVNGTQVAFAGVAAGGPVKDSGMLSFPNDDPTPAELSASLQAKADKAELEALRVRVQALEQGGSETQAKGAPFPALAALVAVLGLAVALRRR